MNHIQHTEQGDTIMFPKNTWYVACTPDEIDVKPLGRTICNERIAFYRVAANEVAAVEDFCPHRGAPLSLGYVSEGKLVCGYHGLEMGCNGKTVAMPDTVITSRYMENIMAPPFWKMALRANHLADDVPVDRWQICRFTPPSHVIIEVGLAHAGHGGYNAPKEHKVYSQVIDFITPETDTSMHYFWGMARQFNPQDKALTAQIREGQGKIFAEDLEMLERQQANLLTWPQRGLLKLNIDTGGVQSRRVIDRVIAAESQVSP